MNHTTEPGRVVSTRTAVPVEAVRALLEVRELEVSFPYTHEDDVKPVRGLSFRLFERQRLAVVGESGSGKSLTALAIMRLVRPPGRITGEIVFKGRDLLKLSTTEIAHVRGGSIAMVYQDPLSSLNPLLTVGDQIVEAIRTHRKVTCAAARSRAIEMLREIGIARAEQRIHSYPHEFSGGMRQRAMIAMAMSTEPELLIADEITSALDVTTQARIIELLLELVEHRATAVMFITHDVGVAASFCSDVQVMYGGRIVERAETPRLYAHPVHPYSEALLQSQCHLETDISSEIPTIPGQPPLAERLPSGCTFHPRCPYAQSICQDVAPEPVVLPDSPDSIAECHFAIERHKAASGSDRKCAS